MATDSGKQTEPTKLNPGNAPAGNRESGANSPRPNDNRQSGGQSSSGHSGGGRSDGGRSDGGRSGGGQSGGGQSGGDRNRGQSQGQGTPRQGDGHAQRSPNRDGQQNRDGGQNRDGRSNQGGQSQGGHYQGGQNQNRDGRPAQQRDGGQRDGGQRDGSQSRDGNQQRDGGQNRYGGQGGQQRSGQQTQGGQPRDGSQHRDGGQQRDGRPAPPREGGQRDGGQRDGGQQRDGRPAQSGQQRDGGQSRDGQRTDRGGGDRTQQGARPYQPGGNRDGRPGGSRPMGSIPTAAGARPAGGRGGDNRGRGQQRPRQETRRQREEREEREAIEAKLARELSKTLVKEAPKGPPSEVTVSDAITVRDLAQLMERSPIDLIKILMQYGIMAPITHSIDHDTAVILGEELGVRVKRPKGEEKETEISSEEIVKITLTRVKQVLAEEKESDLVSRPPVVAVLGHVDHGKTTLLDRVRHTDVASGEAGGITQRTGAYQVMIKGQKITFLDTPGHEAFTAMRARGARVTDIVVLVVAADDGVMPQTKEAISHAKAAGVQIMVAINKIDKPNANPDRVMQELTDQGLQPEQWGGDTIMVPVSALRNQGIDDLLSNIVVLAEVEDYKANPKGQLVGTVIEASLDKQRGVTTTLLVQNGTLHAGDSVVVGNTWGRIRALFDYEGKPIKSASPSTPVVVLGLQEAPLAGDLFEGVENDRAAKEIAEQRKAAALATSKADVRPQMTLEDIFARFAGGETKTLNLIVRADLQGTLEPVVKSLEDLDNEHKEIDVKILQAAVGNVSESDVMLAEASDAVIIAFSVDTDKSAAARAEQSGVEIRHYDIIYKMIEDVQDALKGMLDPVYENVTVAHANILQLFKLRRGFIAGCTVTDGTIKRGALARALRAGTEILTDVRVETLRRFTEDVNEVRQGFECGIRLSGKDELLQLGDVIEVYERQRKR